MAKEAAQGLELIQETIQKQRGILFAEPAIVHRATYSGRDMLGLNSKFEPGYVDERGYVPVEWWIMSVTQAGNDILKPGEGITQIYLGDSQVSLLRLAKEFPERIFGGYADSWPLTKILDIGGAPKHPSWNSELSEVPPIPVHIHSGEVENGEMKIKSGKLEAYFFPPVSVPPYNKDFGTVITRLGLKPTTTKEEVVEGLKQFGVTDEMYLKLNQYTISPNEGWYIKPGVIHAPGPWVTFEIQRPQDDFHLCAWQLGTHLCGHELQEHREKYLLKGLRDEKEFVEKALDWKTNVDPNFQTKFRNLPQTIASGEWGERFQIFFRKFYGEGFEIKPKQTYVMPAQEKPFAGMVWSGRGLINGNALNVDNKKAKEFLVVPGTEATIYNDGSHSLLIYTVFPFKTK